MAEQKNHGAAPEEQLPDASLAGPPPRVDPAAAESERPEEPPRLSRADIRKMTRRELLGLSPLLLAGAFAVPKLRTALLARGVATADWASGKIFSRARLAPTFSDSSVVPFEKFPYNGYDVIDPQVDLGNWTLTVEGEMKHPGKYTLAQIQALPKVVQNTRHVCVEGWDVIGSFGGARVGDFWDLVGANAASRFVEVECADDYFESLDMETMLHPQSLLCYEMYGQPLKRGHGAPLRLCLPTKLGYKQPKYLTTLRITNVLKPETGYWEGQGYSWFGGM